ncbi:hypothetical protein mRhiFer1_009538 [Rhinolophus ferrumequinum]|uniref:Uncharacterized protein n=1 Tax=Rhinolophus ferrumequinum TaxID=59479 RepID=A0A7J7R8A0_RHIFE|nr:hypothetical protein mRhiFer1_009538 [Rhinolophus ferrumequinum]
MRLLASEVQVVVSWAMNGRETQYAASSSHFCLEGGWPGTQDTWQSHSGWTLAMSHRRAFLLLRRRAVGGSEPPVPVASLGRCRERDFQWPVVSGLAPGFPGPEEQAEELQGGAGAQVHVWAVLAQRGFAEPWGSETYLGDALGKARARGLSSEKISSLSPASTRAACISSVP